MLKGFEIAASGMAAQRVRLNLVSSNLANASTTRTAEGGPYQRQEAVFSARPVGAQDADPAGQALRAVEVVDVQRDPAPGPLLYDPTHPDADADGNVRMPNVNMVEEMVDMIGASRSFEANTQAFAALRDMALKALEIGR